jgi:hypothetical protein
LRCPLVGHCGLERVACRDGGCIDDAPAPAEPQCAYLAVAADIILEIVDPVEIMTDTGAYTDAIFGIFG